VIVSPIMTNQSRYAREVLGNTGAFNNDIVAAELVFEAVMAISERRYRMRVEHILAGNGSPNEIRYAAEVYKTQAEEAKAMLEGSIKSAQQRLTESMEDASNALRKSLAASLKTFSAEVDVQEQRAVEDAIHPAPHRKKAA
jgi:hypothetical protein